MRIHSGIAFSSSLDWNEADVRAAVSDFVAPGLTASGLGFSWQQESGYQRLDGLWPLSIAVRGKYLVIADSPALLAKMLSGLERPTEAQPATFIAAFDHARERDRFKELSSLVDRNAPASTFTPNAREPQFFSDNMASFSQTFAKVSREKILERRRRLQVRWRRTAICFSY